MLRDYYPVAEAPTPDNATAAGVLPLLHPASLQKIGRGRARSGNVAMLYLGDAVIRSAARLVAGASGAMAVPISAVTGMVPLVRQRDGLLEAYLRRRQLDANSHRLLCARGIELIYAALPDATGEYPATRPAHEIIAHAVSSRCMLSIEAVERFCEMAGWAAADTALSAGAWGGVVIAGPVGQRLRHVFGQTRFRAMFEGRHRAIAGMEEIPTYVLRPLLTR